MAALLVCALALVVAGCGSSSSSSTTAAGGESTSAEKEEASGGGGEAGGGGENAEAKIAIVLTNPENSSFGQTAVNAAKQIESELGNEVTVQGGLTPANEQQTFEGYASRGTGLLIIDGAEMQQAAEAVAPKFPKTDFVVINGNAEGSPNLSSATYKWEEVGFLAGVVAGKATEANKVGQISSIEIPPIEGIYDGFVQGVKAANPKATTTNSYSGSNTEPGKAQAVTSVQASQGVDTVFTVATGADPGVFSAAKDKGLKVIGYGIDESNLGESVILTSTLVDYEGTMFEMAKKYVNGELEPTVYTYGFEDEAFSLAPVTNVAKSTAAEIEKIAAEAIAGKFKIKPFEG
ncbi:MAG: BMP family protein [Actinobacteria bacterium]|nr:BMP family protein [Actinomycetota bacterium]